MNLSLRSEEQRGDRLLCVLTDEANGIRLIVSRLGAELISVTRRNSAGKWIGFLNRDNEIGKPESGWANHATVMGYYLHRIKNERSVYRGQEIRGGTHSFLREKLMGSYILELVDVPERTFTFSDPPSGRIVSLDLTSVPYLTLWSDGGPFLCVEPCWGLTDHHEQRPFEDKEGIQKIPAGQERVAGFTFEPRLV